MPLKEVKSDAPLPIPSLPIVDIYLDDIVVHHPFVNAAPLFALPLITNDTTSRIQSSLESSWTYADLRSHHPGDWAAAFHSLILDDLHGQGALDLAPATVLSVHVLAPARVSVPVLAPAVVHYLRVAIPRRPESSEAIFLLQVSLKTN